MARTSYFQCNDDDVRFVPDQHASLVLCSASSLKQQCVCKHVAPSGHIIMIPNNSHVLAESLHIKRLISRFRIPWKNNWFQTIVRVRYCESWNINVCCGNSLLCFSSSGAIFSGLSLRYSLTVLTMQYVFPFRAYANGAEL
jgi:hypothetical protein